jgi:hypothetical protein
MNTLRNVSLKRKMNEMMVGFLDIIEIFWRQQNMYEIRKVGKTFRIYDSGRNHYVAHTRDESLANRMVTYTLKNCGFQGEVPAFMLYETKYGINLDEKS